MRGVGDYHTRPRAEMEKAMHAAKLAKSARMQAILAFMRERGTSGATSWEIAERFRVLNIGTEMAALRANGITVNCECLGMNENGRRIYVYRVA